MTIDKKLWKKDQTVRGDKSNAILQGFPNDRPRISTQKKSKRKGLCLTMEATN